MAQLVGICFDPGVFAFDSGVFAFGPGIFAIALNDIRVKDNLLEYLEIVLVVVLNLKHELKELEVEGPVDTVVSTEVLDDSVGTQKVRFKKLRSVLLVA